MILASACTTAATAANRPAPDAVSVFANSTPVADTSETATVTATSAPAYDARRVLSVETASASSSVTQYCHPCCNLLRGGLVEAVEQPSVGKKDDAIGTSSSDRVMCDHDDRLTESIYRLTQRIQDGTA